MAAVTKGVLCPANAWTVIATGKESVMVVLRQIGVGYLKTGTSLPADAPSLDAAADAAAGDFVTISHARGATLGFLDTTTNVYFYPSGGKSLTVEVVSE